MGLSQNYNIYNCYYFTLFAVLPLSPSNRYHGNPNSKHSCR